MGWLERFVGDWALQQGEALSGFSASSGASAATFRALAANEPSRTKREFSLSSSTPKGPAAPGNADSKIPESASPLKIAIIGSGPSGLACAQDLATAGIDVTIFEALHEAGGVLSYGIPPFRLPRSIVAKEIDQLKHLGVHFELNKVIGKIFTIEELLREKDFQAVFIGTGAGLPKFLGLPGEQLNGVMSANEFLTRLNLMGGYRKADTPVGMGNQVTVIGAGNTALDSARIALRLGATVTVVYRRTESESPARAEELRHAKEEGVRFEWLTNPLGYLGDDHHCVRTMRCLRMALGEPDESGRRSPHPLPGTEFEIPTDTVIYALGTVANPIIGRSTLGLKTNRWGYIEVDPETGMTSLPGVFAGGDIVTGAATVIQALGAGRKAARGILRYLNKENVKEVSYAVAMP
ncbi:MAG: FAD-dependent oxidoreductase [Deltaproteobacteria bacterium]|nr:FAD-dependent oxidoreductase [Deltaproteobacteria bacterium]